MHPLSVFIALQAGGEWKITQLRDMLAALLVKTPEQDMIFQRRFKEFFYLHVPAELSKVDVQRAQDLGSPFEQTKVPLGQQNNDQQISEPNPVNENKNSSGTDVGDLTSPRVKWFKRKYALLGLIGITFGFIIWLIVWVLT